MRNLGTATLTVATVVGVFGLSTAHSITQQVYTPTPNETLSRSSSFAAPITTKDMNISAVSRNSDYINLTKIIPEADRDLLNDASAFYGLTKNLDWKPDIWADDGEIAFEWLKGDRHAIVSFDGDGTYGYAMKVGDRFVPGEVPSPDAYILPDDLKAYVGGA